MSRIALSLACGDYDRTRALEDGSVTADGIELIYLRLPVEETFFRMLRHEEFDVAEMSLSSYTASLDAEGRGRFVALPVYTSRMFRHSSVYVNTNLVATPEDLTGAVVGTPEWQLTACVWVRGILDEHYGVPFDSVSYRTGGQESPGRIEKAVVDLGGRVDIESIAAERTLADMLETGEIAALQTPRVPSPFLRGVAHVRRLWSDTVAEEQAWFARTAIFPIMHVVVVRRDIYEKHPWVAQSLAKAFGRARDDARERIYDSSALRFMEPWLLQHLEQARDRLGHDFWSYGVAQNRAVLQAFLGYHHAQGLSIRRFDPDEIFAPESLESFII